MPERYHQLAGQYSRSPKKVAGFEPRTPPHHPPSPIADTLDICPSERYRHRHTYGHGITESRHGCSSAIPALSLSPLSLLSLATVLRAYFRRLAFSPSLLHKKRRRRTIHRLTIDPVTNRTEAASCRDKSKVWLLGATATMPRPFFVQRHTRQNEYSY
jgi:hypothetical protein